MIFFRIFVTLLILLLQLILQQHSNTPVVLKINVFCLYFFPPIVENMNQEKLAKLQAQVRIGGKVRCKNEGILIAELVQHHLGHIKQIVVLQFVVIITSYCSFLKSFLIVLPAENKH